MGRCSSGGPWWAFLLLVGVLLAAAAMPTAVGQWDCDARCVVSHSSDPWKVPMCVLRCHTGGVHAAADGNGSPRCEKECAFLSATPDIKAFCMERCKKKVSGGSRDAVVVDEGRDRCHKMCQKHSDLMEQLRCMQQCRQEEGGGSRDAAVADEGRDRCQKICQKHSDLMEQLRCMQQCRQEEGGGSRDAAVVVDEGRDRCQKMCQKHSDLMEQLRCMQQCREGRPEEGGARNDDANRHGGDRCKKHCARQYLHDYEKWKQCVDSCRGSGMKTVVGAILEVV